jgi:hypothetical protein
MWTRVAIALLLLSVIPFASAKDKKKQVLPDIVLRAQRVYVTIAPDAGEPVNNPMANRTAQQDVEKALSRWGRFDLTMEPSTADLVIAVRKGMASGTVIRNAPQDNRRVIYQKNPSDVRIGGQTGRPGGDVTDAAGNEDNGPRISNQMGSPDDSFEVYMGGGDYPLDASPLWRYVAKNALNGPQVPAVEQFKKVLEESQKQSQQKP